MDEVAEWIEGEDEGGGGSLDCRKFGNGGISGDRITIRLEDVDDCGLVGGELDRVGVGGEEGGPGEFHDG